jgi:hypothetical protein
MKKSQLISMFFSGLFIAIASNNLFAQGLTIPDYTYGMVNSEYGFVNNLGVTSPGPYGGYSVEENERQSGVFFGHGYRSWGYPSHPLLICSYLPRFNFPGAHGIWNTTAACMNPPIGFKSSWGGVVVDPVSRTIWGIVGARNSNGPTASYCIPNPYGPGQICYGAPSNWGYGSAYGYLRKAVIVQSTGVLNTGDPVQIKASMTEIRQSEGDGTATAMGVMFMDKMSNTMWAQFEGFSREYLRWGDVQDWFGNSKLSINESGTVETTMTFAVGDTIVVEIAFNNTITLVNPKSPVEAEGWSGVQPHNLLVNTSYVRTDTVKKIIREKGNSLTYNLTCLTTGAILGILTVHGPNVDEDKDGISDAQEKGANGDENSYDGNSDGIPDYKQAEVASFHTFNGENYVTLAVPAGTALSQMKVTDNPSLVDAPADAQFPFGFFDFTIEGIDEGEAVAVTLILHGGESVNKYYKYGLTPDNLTFHWYEFMYDGLTGAEINGSIITLHFVDGLRGDEDITVNGSIKEPGGPAISGTTMVSELMTDAGVSVYPNPAGSFITLKVNDMPAGNYFVSINAITGMTLMEKVVEVCDSGQLVVIPTDRLPVGIYVVSLKGSGNVFKSKFIIK